MVPEFILDELFWKQWLTRHEDLRLLESCVYIHQRYELRGDLWRGWLEEWAREMIRNGIKIADAETGRTTRR